MYDWMSQEHYWLCMKYDVHKIARDCPDCVREEVASETFPIKWSLGVYRDGHFETTPEDSKQ